MFYSFSLISFIIIVAPRFLISIINAIPSVEDKMLIAFMKGHQETQISDYSMQKYEAHLGIVYFMRTNWQCDEIADEFEEYERTECQKYRKYFDFLYEYLYREYLGIQTVKPKFVFKKQIEIERPIIYAVNCLVGISQFYFIKREGKAFGYKLNKLFACRSEPKLLNEERLNYDQKLPINEMILQLAIDTANEWQINESLNRIILQNYGDKFEEHLKEMFKKAEEKAKKDNNSRRANEINDDKHLIILEIKFNDPWNWIEDALFSSFVKGLATNSEKFFKMANEYSNYLSREKEKGNIHWYHEKRMVSFGLCENEKMQEHLQQKYEARLGVVYLMRKNWKCEKIEKEFKKYERTDCQTNRKYLDILYEYLFRLYVEGKSAEFANKFPAVKPIIMRDYNDFQIAIISVIKILNKISQCFWQKDENELRNFDSKKLILVNEVELNYGIKEEENWFNKFKQILLDKINGPINVQKNGKKFLNLSNEIEDNLWQEFEQKMKKMYENTKENAKLEKAIEKAANNGETYNLLEAEYDDKFGTFNSSPLS